ncbi:Oxysterol-Hypothetical protein protein [Nesidiocoris tenuis]|uniref:PH domain-containing protein n=1 Tax=Nesidiocoris tenuis TaxID=355587 RepID=A0ABN7AJB2_9HEMI|nr:Oxysterol-Hypothetical protein protein [Nesidiocoris tenuis]
MIRGVRRGCVRLKGAVIGIDDEDDSTFTITVDSKTFHFQARDGDEREKWIRCLEDTILRHAYGYKSPSSLRLDMMKASPTMHDFDKKLSEADAYLQLLIDQSKVVENKMELLTDPDDKNRCNIISTHANNMLEQMKHTIVLLQIAKNTAHPVNGTYQPLSGDSEPPKTHEGPSVAPFMPYTIGVDAGVEIGGPHPSLSLPTVVPETSYSSSEEEDFYDANDDDTSVALNFGPEDTRLGRRSRSPSDVLRSAVKSPCRIPSLFSMRAALRIASDGRPPTAAKSDLCLNRRDALPEGGCRRGSDRQE